ncbi:hypothetical protein [Wenxinia saemankumensis]|uniref:Invasion protein IalB, involved in pathogenesis n=1 Tax=Wenxinia saemankumensis TaxID=1447782 RepID=A0A1M6FXL8_9RHOB|nr:hypothetical protein [Wenxinia saemankumensis]SHJ02404.1 Invasion protein IalB, involved in pathogenesis [Wenxinia saemankumensis]
MHSRTIRAVGPAALILAALTLTAPAASAQDEATNRVAAATDWSVFQESDPVECFAVSAPKESLNTRNGSPVEVNRGETLLFVFYRPSEGVNGQVTFTGGYPFASGSTVSLNIGGTDYQLFTEGEWAWPATPEDDNRIVTAMRAGAEAVLTGQSGRGTQTRDTFSLLGFTASVEEAQRRCAG